VENFCDCGKLLEVLMKKKYNIMVEKIKKQEEWLEKNKKRPDIETFIQKFLKTIEENDNIIKEIEKEIGRKMTSHEILEGFKDD
jgi:hypothetical protein